MLHSKGQQTELMSVPWISQTLIFARRQFQQLSKNKLIIFLTIGWPILWFVLTLEIFLEEGEVPNTDMSTVKAFVGISLGIFGAFTIAVTYFAGGFVRDTNSGMFKKLKSMPISPTADLIGRMIPGILLGCISYMITIIFSYFYGAEFENPGPHGIVKIMFTLIMFNIIAMSISIPIGIWIKKPEYLATISIVIVFIIYNITGFNGTNPSLVGDNSSIINYIPNSFITRLHIDLLSNYNISPPTVPNGFIHYIVFSTYFIVLFIISLIFIERYVYRRNE